MRGIFGGESSAKSRGAETARVSRHSSGWKDLLAYLRSHESQRVLDIGPTSSTNINYITNLGHSIYMANIVEEAANPEWVTTNSEGETTYDIDRFLVSNLNFSGRNFDVVLFWDTADYLPEPLVAPVLSRIHQVMEPSGVLLGFFHINADPGAKFCRYHLTDNDVVEMQRAGDYPMHQIYSNRKIENLLSGFSSYRFFLAKDNLREVIATR